VRGRFRSSSGRKGCSPSLPGRRERKKKNFIPVPDWKRKEKKGNFSTRPRWGYAEKIGPTSYPFKKKKRELREGKGAPFSLLAGEFRQCGLAKKGEKKKKYI